MQPFEPGTLELYVLGALSSEEAEEVRAALEQQPGLRRELQEIEEALGLVAAALPPAPAPPALRRRIEASIAHRDRFEWLVPAMARLLKAGQDRARQLLRLIDDPEPWLSMGGPCSFVHIRPEPALAGFDVGFVRVEAGGEFPMHEHLGPEAVLIIQGTVTDSLGNTARAGDVVEMEPGTAHSLRAGEDGDLIYLAVVGGVRFEGAEGPLELPEEQW